MRNIQPKQLCHTRQPQHAIVLFLLLCWIPYFPIANATEPHVPVWRLYEAPYQLEVTILAIDEVPLKRSDFCDVLHRVRVDRVLLGAHIQVDDELTLVSYRRVKSSAGPGASGHRGLPEVGDHARVFAESDLTNFKVISPSGWRNAEPNAKYFMTGCDDNTIRNLVSIAMNMEERSIINCAFTDPRDTSTKAPDWYKEPSHRFGWPSREADFSVLCLSNTLTISELETMLSSFFNGLPIAALGETLHAIAMSPTLDEQSSTVRKVGRKSKPKPTMASDEVFGALRVRRSDTEPLRLHTPDKPFASHAILKGIESELSNIEISSIDSIVEELAPDCQVLVYGVIQAPNQAEPLIVPVLWVREIPHSAKNRYNRALGKIIPELTLPPQRVMATILSPNDASKYPAIKTLLENAIRWIGSCEE